MTKLNIKKSLYGQCVRLHVRANSNSEADQQKKLLARDAVNALLAPKMLRCQSRTDAIVTLCSLIGDIELAARQASGQPAYACVKNELFPDKDYNGKTFPAGEYMALTVTLGSGTGQNWWCVVYPPMCFTQDGYYSRLLNFFKRLFG